MFKYDSTTSLWDFYLHDFLCHQFSLDLNEEQGNDYVKILLTQLTSSDLLKSADNIVSQIFGLHVYVEMNRLKLTRAMPTLRKIWNLKKLSYNESPEVSVEYTCDVLFSNLENSIGSASAELELEKWYKLYMEVVS